MRRGFRMHRVGRLGIGGLCVETGVYWMYEIQREQQSRATMRKAGKRGQGVDNILSQSYSQ